MALQVQLIKICVTENDWIQLINQYLKLSVD